MQKKKNRVKACFVILILASIFLTKIGFTQEPATSPAPAKEIKWFWKKNELLIGVGSAFAFTLIVYAFWRKKKKGVNNIDSTM